MKGFHAYPTRISQHLFTAGGQFVFTASISSEAAGRRQRAAVGTFFHAVDTFFHGGVSFSHGIYFRLGGCEVKRGAT